MAGIDNLKHFTSETAAIAGAKGGANKKGSKHLSTHIQEMLNDEDFETQVLDAKTGIKEFKGAPIKAIIATARHKAIHGDDKAREWLAKYGYGQKFEVDQNISGQLDTGIQDPQLAADFAEYLKHKG